MRKIKDLFNATLPKNHSIALTTALLGGIISGSLASNIPFFFLGLFITFGWLGAANVLNMITDKEIDKINLPSRPLPSGRISEKELLYFYIFLVALTLLPALFISSALFIVALAGVLIGIIYSVKPIRFKERYLVSNMSIAFGYGIVSFLIGFLSAGGSLSSVPIWMPIFLFFLDIGGSISKDYKDIEGDKIFGMRTLPVVHEKNTCVKIHSIFLLLPFAVLILLSLLFILPFSYILAGALIFLALSILLKIKKSNSQNEYKKLFFYIILLATLVRIMLIVGWLFA